MAGVVEKERPREARVREGHLTAGGSPACLFLDGCSHACAGAISRGTGSDNPSGPSWLCPACSCRAAGSSVFGIYVGRGVCLSRCVPGERESLCRLWVFRGVFFHQTAPKRPRPQRGMGEQALSGLARGSPGPSAQLGRGLGWCWAQRHLVGPQGGICGMSGKLMASAGRKRDGDGEEWSRGTWKAKPLPEPGPPDPDCANFLGQKRSKRLP